MPFLGSYSKYMKGEVRTYGLTDTVGNEPAVTPGIDSAILSDDTQALTLLYERYRRPIYTSMYRLLGNQEDAADATQEVFLRACVSWENLRDRQNLVEWLYRVATNLCIDLIRRRKRLSWWPLTRRNRDGEEHEEEESENESLALNAANQGGIVVVAEREHIQFALACLPRDYAVVLVLSVAQGFPYQEIARIIGLSPGATASRLSGAKKMFVEQYQRIGRENSEKREKGP
ncbi:MAG: hypothetical protein NVSMB27_27870 [Ktedonobacteraceae bacterium]